MISTIDITGYTPKDLTDWGPSIQQAIDDLVDTNGRWPCTSGGSIHFPKGRYPVITPITVRCPGVLMSGVGNGHTYACTIEWNNTDSTAALFQFVAPPVKSKRSYGFSMSNIRLIGKREGTAFKFGPPHKAYCGPFSFEYVTVSHFKTVFKATPKTKRAWGNVSCDRCRFIYNGQIMVGVDGGHFNESRFNDCLMSKNGLREEGWPEAYAIDLVAGSNLAFNNCILEGQPRAIRIQKAQNVRLIGVRFESNATSDDPVGLLKNCRGVWIQAYHRITSLDKGTTFLIQNCENYHLEPMLGTVVIKNDWKPVY